MDYFTIIFPSIMSLAGIYVGYWFTNRNQIKLHDKERENIKRENYHAFLQEQMLVYSHYLDVKVNISILIREEENDYFNFDVYLTKYRPIFSKKFHLLDEDVLRWILSIDKYIETIRLMEGELNKSLDIEIHDELLIWFATLDLEIMKNLSKYKKNVIDGYFLENDSHL